MKIVIHLIVFLAFSSFSLAQHNIKLSSPDGQIQFSFKVKDKPPGYSVSYKKMQLISEGGLGLSFLESGPLIHLEVLQPIYRDAVEDYELVVGKTKKVHDQYKEVIIPLQEKEMPGRKINFVVRIFNDGLAFRYEFPKQSNWTSYSLTDENTSFKFASDPKVLALFLPGYTTSHEGEYSSIQLSAVKEDTLMDMPALFEFPGQTYLAITEAALVDYAGMYLAKKNGVLRSMLSPLPTQGNIKVKAILPHRTPWRVLLISDRIGSLIESNILTSLNEPCKIKDVSWIKPGKTTFPWWNGSIIPDTTFAPGNNFENNQYYIDFCARNGIEFHSVVESCGHEWYTNDGQGYQPGPNNDVTKPVPGLDMKVICDYAASKGVGIRVWVHWAALYPRLDSAFAIFEKWGIKGMMIDFMDRDDQQMVNIQTEMLEKAAAHKLHIQFHGAYKPTGLSRTYPNEFTREGTLNYESFKWSKVTTPDHDINMPFTRMLAGSTDYHLGGFRAVPDSLFKIQYTRPLVLGTRCHMLAMYAVLENYQGMVCDYPYAYEGQPGFDFIKQIPTTWDETKVLDAKLKEYVTIARRKGDDWYIGSITNGKARQITVSFNFLNDGEYIAEIYSDAADTGVNPNHLVKQIRSVNSKDKIQIHLAPGGGAAFHIRKK